MCIILDFQVLYTSATVGHASTSPDIEGEDMRPLMDAIIDHIPGPSGDPDAPLQLQVSTIEHSPFLGRLGIGKISAGRVSTGMPVVVAEGVVGRVVRSSPRFSRVLLVTDASSAVASLLQHNRARGVCRGQGEQLVFDFVLRQEEVKAGDRVVTSGMGGIFPKGLVVGYVGSVERQDFGLFQAIEVIPSVDFSHLEEVLVLLRGPQ